MKHEFAKDIIAAGRADSVLDPKIPLGYPTSLRPERGPSEAEYYRERHRKIGHGKYFGLHVTSFNRDLRR